MQGFFSEMLSGSEKVSSKRVLTTLASLLVFAVTLVDLFTDLTVSDYVFDGLIWMAIAGFGSTAIEAFARRPMRQNTPYGGYGGYGGYSDYGSYGGYSSTTPSSSTDLMEPNPNPKQDVIV